MNICETETCIKKFYSSNFLYDYQHPTSNMAFIDFLLNPKLGQPSFESKPFVDPSDGSTVLKRWISAISDNTYQRQNAMCSNFKYKNSAIEWRLRNNCSWGRYNVLQRFLQNNDFALHVIIMTGKRSLMFVKVGKFLEVLFCVLYMLFYGIFYFFAHSCTSTFVGNSCHGSSSWCKIPLAHSIALLLSCTHSQFVVRCFFSGERSVLWRCWRRSILT